MLDQVLLKLFKKLFKKFNIFALLFITRVHTKQKVCSFFQKNHLINIIVLFISSFHASFHIKTAKLKIKMFEYLRTKILNNTEKIIK